MGATASKEGLGLTAGSDRRLLAGLRQTLRRAPALTVGLAILAPVLFFALFVPFWVPDPNAQDVLNRLEPPSLQHPFGLDEFGRDVLARMAHGARLTLIVATSVAVLAGAAGLVIGLVAGSSRKLDNVLMRVMDGLMAFPGIVLALGLVAALGPRVSNVVIALATVYTPTVTRLIRSAVLSLRDQEFTVAARSLGARESAIVIRHILPNLVAPLVLQVSFIFGFSIVAEAGLSFLGVGAPPEQPTWGTILATARAYLHQAVHLTFIPGFAIFMTVLGLNFLGDGLQDALDPRLRRRL